MPVRALALALVASIPLACSPDPPAGAAVSAADVQLAAFAREHPECKLWTNWRMMCSRTGPGGETHCTTDPDRPVAPSAPFCVFAGEGADPPVLEPPQGGSPERFCTRTRLYGIYRGPGSDPNERIRVCTQYDSRRPFNGRNLAARRHPWCREWSDTNSEQPVCTEDAGRDSLPDCGTLARRSYRHRRPLYCSRLAPPPWCERAEAMLERLERNPDGHIVRDVRYRNSDFHPVHGMVCRRRRNDG